ncbi:unnamed protein product [Rotaria sp. Silwood2]|nr:unnamed protein product [Rotaria sp. Silwood2]CAF2665181.1 unnamed protein product [Rotaria sp. Silwood2]CAF3081661.1 unnamed protein product [Rotaria sp. Silwood2]CAF3936863.1 unnamed protein product [Rotaria sp. Silwood2]
MPIKRKIRNLPNTNDQMSFFDPVYPNDNIQQSDNENENENDLLAESIPRPTFGKGNKDELNETNDTDTITNNNQDPPSEMISAAKIMNRIKQIQNSIEQAQTMLESMKKFKNLVPDNDGQYEKLRSLIANLQEQQASYINLLNLITLTAEEQSTGTNKNSTSHRQTQMNTHDDDDNDNDLSLRRNVQLAVRPRIESKTGFIPQTINLSDNEQTNRNDNSNYDSLVGSLKSDTINWKDQQSTSNDEESDGENEKEMEKNLMLQKEQLRALQGQKRALIALKRRSEQRLIEQQQLISKKSTNLKKTNEENNLLSDIDNIRNRLKLLRNVYEQKYQDEIQQAKNSSNKSQKQTENRLKNLEHVRERLDELEQIVTYYQTDLNNQHDEDTPIQSDDAQYLKTFSQQKRQTYNNDNASKQFSKVSNDLAAKRLELEQAKSALTQLQQMVKTIQPDEYSSSANSTPIQKKPSSKRNSFEHSTNSIDCTPTSSQQNQTGTPIANKRSSLLSNILSPQQVPQPLPTINNYVDTKMAAQHREIEHLIESRQRLHTIKDQIASLQQTMETPSIQQKKDFTNEIKVDNDKLNDSKNIRPSYRSNQQECLSQDDDNELELCNFECVSDNEEQTDDDNDNNIQMNYYFPSQQNQPHIKQTNLCASENVVTKHDQQSDELSAQMREICRCLSTFIEEQKSFNHNIEQRLTNVTKPALLQTIDPTFSQLQQQTLTQSLIVNLNAAYREIAVLQSEINALQSENSRLTSSISFDNQYHHHHIPRSYSRDNSKDSIYSFDQIKSNIRPQPRSRFDEQLKQQNQLLTTNHLFENSSKTSFNSQSTGKQTAIQVEATHKETTPIKQERTTKLSTERLSSPKPTYIRSKQMSSINDLPSHHDHSIKDDLSKSFPIYRRPILNDNENNQLYNYKQKRDQQSSSSSSSSSSANDYQRMQQDTLKNDNSDDEQKSNDFVATMFNTQPSAYYTSITQDMENVDLQTLDLQVKSIMVQLIPFMRLRIDEVFNQSTLNHIRERILFLFKQQPDSAELIRHFQNPFSELIEKTIEKYCGTSIRDCAADLIRDISDVAFDELVKYKIYENKNNLQTKNHTEQNTELLTKQEDEYAHLYGPSAAYYTQQVSPIDDGENDNKYQIELAESEDRPLTLIGSDEEDNDADQEENTDSELETAVSRQETYYHEDESPIPTDINSNGHEYVVVNHSTSNNIVPENEEQKNDDKNEEINNS